MAKIFYIEDANGEYFSADKTRRFRALQGKKLHDYLKTPEGRAKNFLIEDNVGVEIPSSSLKEILIYKRRKQYVNDIIKEHEYIVVSLYSDIMISGDCTGEDVISDEDTNVEDTVIHSMMLEKLKTALTYLTDDEHELITQLIYTDMPISQRELARKTGLPQKTIDNRKASILRKLKKYLED